MNILAVLPARAGFHTKNHPRKDQPMTTNPDQTTTIKRGPGRPKTTIEKQSTVPVVLDMSLRFVPPLICPVCRRGMSPRLKRWRPLDSRGVASADCLCSLCGGSFVYTPAVVRSKNN